MKFAVKTLFLVTLIVSGFGQQVRGQVGNFDFLELERDNGTAPFIRMYTPNGSSHYIVGYSGNIGFSASAGSTYPFRIFASADDNALTLNSNGVNVGEDNTINMSDFDGNARKFINIEHADTMQSFGITSASSFNGTNGGGIGFATSSASFPFWVYDSAENESLAVRKEGVGVGIYRADEPLHVYADGTPFDSAKVLVENNLLTTQIREMFSLVNNGGCQFSFSDTSNDSKWFFTTDSGRRFVISIDGTGGPEFTIQPDGRVYMGPGSERTFDLRTNGDLHILGTLFQSSDKNLKTEFAHVDANEVLEKVSKLPVTTWRYKSDEDGQRHMGPTAQDFRAAFGLGENDKTITTIDTAGVSLAAIKALHADSQKKDSEIEQLTGLVEKLSARLETIESTIQQQ